MNEQLLKMNGLSVEIPNALSFKAHLWHEFTGADVSGFKLIEEH